MSNLLALLIPVLLPSSIADLCHAGLVRTELKPEQKILLHQASQTGRALRVLRKNVDGVDRVVILLAKVHSPAGMTDEMDLQRAFSRVARQGPHAFVGFWFADSVRELTKWAEEAEPAADEDLGAIDLLAGYRPSLFNRINAVAWVGAKYSWVPSDSLTYAYALAALTGALFPAPVSTLVNAAVFGVTGMQSFASYGWTHGYTRGVLALGRKNRYMARAIVNVLEADRTIVDFFTVVNGPHVDGLARSLRWRGFEDDAEFAPSK